MYYYEWHECNGIPRLEIRMGAGVEKEYESSFDRILNMEFDQVTKAGWQQILSNQERINLLLNLPFDLLTKKDMEEICRHFSQDTGILIEPESEI